MTTLGSIPLVLDGATPFLVAAAPSPLPYAELAGCRLRRGQDRVTVELAVGDLHVTAIMLEAYGSCYVLASAGDLLADLWADPEAALAGVDPEAAPHLTAAVHRRSSVYGGLRVRVVPPSGPLPSLALIATNGSLAANLAEAPALAACAARGLIDVLNEFAAVRPGGSIAAWPAIVGDGVALAAKLSDEG